MKLVASDYLLMWRKALIFSFMTAILISGMPLVVQAQNLVVNGSFETVNPSVTSDTYTAPFGYLPTNGAAGWTFRCSGGNAYDGIATPSGSFGNKIIEDGSNATFIQGTGSVFQTVTLAAGTYTLSFYAMGGNPLTGGNEVNPISISLDSLLSKIVTPTNTSQSNISDWTICIYSFTAPTAGSYTLQFSGTIPFAGGSNFSSFIDNVSIVAAVVSNSTLPFVTVINPSFEDNQVTNDIYTTPNYTTIQSTIDPKTGIPGWLFNVSGNDSDSGIVTETGTLFGSPKYIPQGWQAAFIQGTGWFSQMVTVNAIGTYVIRFRSEGRSNGGTGAEPIMVSVDGNNLGTFTPSTSQWTLFTSMPFTVTAGVHDVTFAGTIPFSQSDRTSFVDAVQIVTPAEAAAVIPPTSLVYDIVFVGDSITAGATLSYPATEASAVMCRESLGQRYNAAVRMSNQGHNGATTVDWLPSTNSSSDFHQAVVAAAALKSNQPGQLIFSIMLGANDSAQNGPNGSPVSPAGCMQNLQSIIDQFLVQYTNAFIFVHYPTWYSTNTQEGSSLYGNVGLARLQAYSPEIDQLISDCAITHPGLVFAGDKQAFNDFSNNYLTEMTPESGAQGTFYLHPNAAGAIVLGKYWADAIAAQLGFAINDSYVAWLMSGDKTPGAPGTGFSDTPTNALVSNGVSYGNPNGLIASLGIGGSASLTVSADIRNDTSLTGILEYSNDLLNWNPLTWSESPSQSGVATGFTRYMVQNPAYYSQNKEFYRIKLTH